MHIKKFRLRTMDCIFLLLSLMLCFGPHFIFPPCGPKSDGTWMNCHWAEQTVIGLGIVLTVLAAVRLLFADARIKAGISIAAVPVSIVTACVPGTLVPLCMMTTMRCHTVMRPAVILIAGTIAVLQAVDAVILIKKTARPSP
ncbi:MAG: DUF4418 family protein [Treponema sp.]|nr:DUF4418 family protein [Treponema sp.]